MDTHDYTGWFITISFTLWLIFWQLRDLVRMYRTRKTIVTLHMTNRNGEWIDLKPTIVESNTRTNHGHDSAPGRPEEN